MGAALLLAGLVLTLAVPALAADPHFALVTRHGSHSTHAFSRFDQEHLVFFLKSGDRKGLLALRQIAAIQFSPDDSVSNVPITDSLDVFTRSDGTTARGIFRRMDSESVDVRFAPGGEQQIPIGSIQQIAFSARVLDVDRREFGKDFDAFGDSVEIRLAERFAADIETEAPLLHDAAIEGYVNALGRRLAAKSKRPDLPYAFKVVNSGTVNAFTIGGGTVYVYRGMLEQVANESELAGILAHEIGHNVCKHTAGMIASRLLPRGLVAGTGAVTDAMSRAMSDSVKRAGGAFTFFSTLAYPDDEERDADYLRVYDVVAAGIDPDGLNRAIEHLQEGQRGAESKFNPYFWTHQTSEGQIEHIDATIDAATNPPSRRPTTKDSPEFRTMLARLRTLPRPIVRQVLSADTVRVEPKQRRSMQWDIDARTLKNCVLKGSFHALGGPGDGIRVVILDEPNYRNFWQNRPATALYDSGVLLTGEFAVPIRKDGKIHIVMENPISPGRAETVVFSLATEHTE